jgi:hypothetical protein
MLTLLAYSDDINVLFAETARSSTGELLLNPFFAPFQTRPYLFVTPFLPSSTLILFGIELLNLHKGQPLFFVFILSCWSTFKF